MQVAAGSKDRIKRSQVPCRAGHGREKGCLNFLSSHGHDEILAPSVHGQLEGKSTGDVIEVPIDGNQIFGPRDDSLVFTSDIESVPEEYRQIGTSILMKSNKGQTRSFLVTRMDDDTLTVDGNNPLCGREVVFTLEILTVRDATDEETRVGEAIMAGADIDPALMRPV